MKYLKKHTIKTMWLKAPDGLIHIDERIIESCDMCPASCYLNNRWTCDACEDKEIEVSEIGAKVEIPKWCPLDDYEVEK